MLYESWGIKHFVWQLATGVEAEDVSGLLAIDNMSVYKMLSIAKTSTQE